MLATDEDALICDLAETYHVFDYKELPCSKVALFAVGLRENSRIKMKMCNIKYSLETMIAASILDRLSMLVWLNTKDGQNGTNRPESVLAKLLGKESGEIMAFDTPEAFEQYKAEIIKRGGI